MFFTKKAARPATAALARAEQDRARKFLEKGRELEAMLPTADAAARERIEAQIKEHAAEAVNSTNLARKLATGES